MAGLVERNVAALPRTKEGRVDGGLTPSKWYVPARRCWRTWRTWCPEPLSLAGCLRLLKGGVGRALLSGAGFPPASEESCRAAVNGRLDVLRGPWMAHALSARQGLFPWPRLLSGVPRNSSERKEQGWWGWEG